MFHHHVDAISTWPEMQDDHSYGSIPTHQFWPSESVQDCHCSYLRNSLTKRKGKTCVIFSKHKTTWLLLCDYLLIYGIFFAMWFKFCFSWLGIIVCLNPLCYELYRIIFRLFLIYLLSKFQEIRYVLSILYYVIS